MISDLPAATRPEQPGRDSGVKECPSRGCRTKINKRPDLDAVAVSFDLVLDIFSRTAASVNPNRNYYDAAAQPACGNSRTNNTYTCPSPCSILFFYLFLSHFLVSCVSIVIITCTYHRVVNYKI